MIKLGALYPIFARFRLFISRPMEGNPGESAQHTDSAPPLERRGAEGGGSSGISGWLLQKGIGILKSSETIYSLLRFSKNVFLFLLVSLLLILLSPLALFKWLRGIEAA